MAGVKGHNVQESFFKNKEGKQLNRVKWPLEIGKTAKASILLCHGFAEHSMRYHDFATFLNSKEFDVFSHDHVGHGKSEGEKVMIDSFDQYVDDVVQHITLIKAEHPDRPLFIVGHSMGGLIAAFVGMKTAHVEGIVFIAGAFTYDPAEATPFKLALGRMISRLFPSFQMRKLSLETLCRDRAVVESYMKDPLVYHGGMKVRWLLLIMSAMTELKSKLASTTYPCLILHGDKDQMVIPAAAHLMHEGLSSTDKTLKIYKGFYHQLHCEPEKDGELVRNDIAEWISARCS